MDVIYEGLCIGGPLDGRRLSWGHNRYIVPIRPPLSVEKSADHSPTEIKQVVYEFVSVITTGPAFQFWMPQGGTVSGSLYRLAATYHLIAVAEPEKAADEAAALAERHRTRINELLEAGNRYQQEARDARAKLAGLQAGRDNLLAGNDALEREIQDMRKERGPWQEQFDKMQLEFMGIRETLRSTGHASAGQDLSRLVDAAIDRERTRRDDSLKAISKALDIAWAADRIPSHEEIVAKCVEVIGRSFIPTRDSAWRAVDKLSSNEWSMDHFNDTVDRVSKQAINAYDQAKAAKSDGGIKSAGSLKATAKEDAPFDPSLYERVQRLEKWVTRLLDHAALGK